MIFSLHPNKSVFLNMRPIRSLISILTDQKQIRYPMNPKKEIIILFVKRKAFFFFFFFYKKHKCRFWGDQHLINVFPFISVLFQTISDSLNINMQTKITFMR